MLFKKPFVGPGKLWWIGTLLLLWTNEHLLFAITKIYREPKWARRCCREAYGGICIHVLLSVRESVNLWFMELHAQLKRYSQPPPSPWTEYILWKISWKKFEFSEFQQYISHLFMPFHVVYSYKVWTYLDRVKVWELQYKTN